jgi:hypothetical protein
VCLLTVEKAVLQGADQMPSLPVLLEKLNDLYHQRARVERDIASVESEILACGRPAPKPRRKRTAIAEVAELVRPLVKVLHDARTPLPLREIASRANMVPAAASYRLRRAVAAKFVEKVGFGRYRTAVEIPEL